jgi:hypothetical protein
MRLYLRLMPALLSLAACTTAPPPVIQSTTEVTKSVEQEGKFISLVGPRRQHGEPFLGVPATNFYALRSWIDTRSGETAHQLYVEDSYFGGKRDWNAAHDSAGAPLRFIEISRNEITCNPDCSYADEFAAVLPEPMLRAGLQGMGVTFDAKAGNRMTIAVPGELIAKQLAAVDAARAPRTVAAVPAK